MTAWSAVCLMALTGEALVLQVPRAPHPLPGIPSWQGQPAGQPLLKMPGQPAWSHNQGAEALGQPASLCQSCSPCFDLATGLQQHTTILLPGSCACLLTELPSDSPHIMSVMHAAGVNGWGPPPRHAPGAAQQNGKADNQEEDEAAPPPPPPPLPSQSDAAAVY